MLHRYLSYSIRLLIFSLCVITIHSPAIAEDTCEIPPMRIDQRPNPNGPPTEVTVGIRFIDISEVNDVQGTITVDIISRIQWIDGRLAGNVGCRLPLTKLWRPRLDVLNSSQLAVRWPFQANQVKISEGGKVTAVQRWYGWVSTKHHLAKFPFDTLDFRINAASIAYDSSEVLLVADEKWFHLTESPNLSNWILKKATSSVTQTGYKSLETIRSTYSVHIVADRDTNFYIWKVLVPLAMIVMMSWSVFWIDPKHFGPQVGLTATVMLTLIAFQFALAGILPKLGYFTIMDKLLLGSTTLVFLSMFLSIATINMVRRGKRDIALKTDALCRWVFPAMFVMLWSISIGLR